MEEINLSKIAEKLTETKTKAIEEKIYEYLEKKGYEFEKSEEGMLKLKDKLDKEGLFLLVYLLCDSLSVTSGSVTDSLVLIIDLISKESVKDVITWLYKKKIGDYMKL